MLPKAERLHHAEAICADVIALVETPRGVEQACAIAQADNVVGMMWGADDLVAGLGGTSSRDDGGTYRDVARYARSRTLIAAKAADKLALDAVHMDIVDDHGWWIACEDAAAVGFDASVAIHPRQVPIIQDAYLPSEDRVIWAQRLLDHVGADRSVTTFEGRMVDGPIFRQAERVLQRAGHGRRS